jgi:two-component system sensor histidine kinase PilS (NtrC family)
MADDTLSHRLKRLMAFRVVIITTLLLIAVYVEAVSETLLPVNPLYFLIAATYALTVLYALALRFVGHLAGQVYVQVILDLLTVTGLVYLVGDAGARGGFILMYPLSVLSGSVLLRGRGLVLAGVATLCYAVLLCAVRAGSIPPEALGNVRLLPLKQLVYSVFLIGVACGTVALIGSYLSESLHNVGAKLEEAAGKVADLRELNQVIVSSLQSGLLTADHEGRVVYVNAFGEGILGRKVRDMGGRTLQEVFGSPLLERSALQARAAHHGLARVEIPYSGPGGAAQELGISVSPLATTEAGRGSYLCVFQDLTNIKRLERDVRIKEKLAAVGEMAAQLAHEIRNPLGSISGSAQVLMGEPNMSPEQGHLLSIITTESKRLSDTLNQFLFQVRSSPRPVAPVNLGLVVNEAVTLLRNAPEVGPHHSVEFESDEGPHMCLADRDQIAQVFWNLARNGLEAMPSGGLLRVRLECRADELVLSVRDQGRGFDSGDQSRLFEPFQSGRPGGTGLGLAIVYRIVRDHHGDIAVRSEPAQGTEVEVRLPRLSLPISA